MSHIFCISFPGGIVLLLSSLTPRAYWHCRSGQPLMNIHQAAARASWADHLHPPVVVVPESAILELVGAIGDIRVAPTGRASRRVAFLRGSNYFWHFCILTNFFFNLSKNSSCIVSA